ncbi:MAG: energy-coupling factor transporter transmembrane component T [Anaerolineae bacterium]|nr:energy-coupling factor transporter transmembrane component T [Anaerolineae bacterium]
MPVIEFIKGKTFFHKLSPLQKIAWGLIILIWMFVTFNPLHTLILGLIVFAHAVFLAGIPAGKLTKTVLVIGIASIFIVVFQTLLYRGETILFDLGPFHPTKEGLYVGLAIAFRILSIVASSMIIARTTDPHDIFLSMTSLGMPYKLAYAVFIALRYIPLMEYEAGNIQSAQFVRGIAKKEGGGLKNRVNQISKFLIPFIAIGIRRADQSALAMEVRGFGLYKTRTNVRKLEFSNTGWIFVAVWATAFIAYNLIMEANVFSVVFFDPPH